MASKLTKAAEIRLLLHDNYHNMKNTCSPLTKYFYKKCTKYVNSTLSRKYTHEQLDEAIASIKADIITPKADSNTEKFLNLLQELSLLIKAYIPNVQMNKRYCEIHTFAISKRTPQMINTYTNLEIFNMTCELEDIIKAWEESQ